jgi:hypothetical protein
VKFCLPIQKIIHDCISISRFEDNETGSTHGPKEDLKMIVFSDGFVNLNFGHFSEKTAYFNGQLLSKMFDKFFGWKLTYI